jgi:asparagine synthase (glutamine-hydrolysing)
MFSHWKNPLEVLSNPMASLPPLESITRELDHSQLLNQFMHLDFLDYLPNDILVKLDRACMAVSLEGRIPLLDYRIIEFAWRLPLKSKVSQGSGKHLLREVLYRHVPRELIERPKRGFGIPLADWLRGPLRDWAETLLAPERIKAEGFFDSATVNNYWTRHIEADENHTERIWPILMFQAWYTRT